MLLEEVQKRYAKLVPDEGYIDQLLKQEQLKNQRKIVVLDDDPTGIQTVHDVSVYTDWSTESIKQGLLEDSSIFYLLTNSRSLTARQTVRLHKELTNNVISAAGETGRSFMIVSRGDSTLRGHYPLETAVIRKVVEDKTDTVINGEILIPFFKEGGRYTIENVHYVDEGGRLTPVAETEFARDKTFGYQSSNLCDYIEEKTEGLYESQEIITISLESLRRMELEEITAKLCSAQAFSKIIVNAVDYIDLKVFCIALFRAMSDSRNYLLRCAASFVKILGGISDRPLLNRTEMVKKNNHGGGIIMIGSYTRKTTKQLEQLKGIPRLEFIEFNSDLVSDASAFEKEIYQVTELAEAMITSGRTAVIYTKRRLLHLEGDTKEEALLRSVKISEAVCRIVTGLSVNPSFIIAKGGITSSDIGVKALGVKHARVLGQIRPGIPVWETDPGSRFPDIPYIIFPGNVGSEATLKEAAEILLGHEANS